MVDISDLSLNSIDPSEDTTELDPIFGLPIIEFTQEQAKKLFNPPDPPKTLLEGLLQRLDKFQEVLDQAKRDNDAPKVRRMGRIVKSYETAIKACKSGKPYDYESLTCPAGFPELPLSSSKSSSATLPDPIPKPQCDEKQYNVPPTSTNSSSKIPQTTASAKTQINQTSNVTKVQPKIAPKPSIKRSGTNLNNHLNYLKERQNQFKSAALEAKKQGNIALAKEYLRFYKGFEPLIDAVNNGIPVDWSSIPKEPMLKQSQKMRRSNEEFSEIVFKEEERNKYIAIFESEFQNQIEFCKKLKNDYSMTTEPATLAFIDECYNQSIKHLNIMKAIKKSNKQIPRIGFLERKFLMVMINFKLDLNQTMVHILKCIDLNCNKDADTYVKITFPFPSGEPQIAKTQVINNTNNPVFDQQFIFEINRKSRSLQRIFKRHPIICEVYSKGGLFRSDTLLGTGNIMLTDLEQKLKIHQICDLKSGKKFVGGKIEVNVFLREPLAGKEIKEISRKWLSFECS